MCRCACVAVFVRSSDFLERTMGMENYGRILHIVRVFAVGEKFMDVLKLFVVEKYVCINLIEFEVGLD